MSLRDKKEAIFPALREVQESKSCLIVALKKGC